MTNEDIYKLVNFITRKDTRGTPETIDNFSRLLQQANGNHFKDEYNTYQANQNINDSMSPFEVKQSVYGLTATATTFNLPTDYAHFIGMYWVDSNSNTRSFDLVTDSEWDMRNNSTITVPTNVYPICRLVSNKLYLKPNLNYVVYADWFLPSRDSLLAMYQNLKYEGVGNFGEDEYWSSSEYNATQAWSIQFSSTGFNPPETTPLKSGTYAVRAARSFEDPLGSYSLRDVGPGGGLVFYIDGTTVYEAAPSDQSSAYVWSNITASAVGTTANIVGSGAQNTLDIIAQSGHTSSSAKVCNDLQIEIGTTSNISILTLILYYIKNPDVPIYDYYRDVNGNYVYLEAGTTHTWVTGEIDSTGTTRTTGQPDWTSLTVELEWKDQDKLKISNRILRSMGVRLSEGEVFQYAQQLNNE